MDAQMPEDFPKKLILLIYQFVITVKKTGLSHYNFHQILH